MITFIEHKETGYAMRTYDNARLADLTIAFALDFTTAGEILTKKAAYGKYYAIQLHTDGNNIMGDCNDAYRLIKEKNIKRLNIAGNGIYSLKGIYTQEMLDSDILLFLDRITGLFGRLDVSIRSGGQTGVDEAALKAGDKLGLQTICLAPKGWMFRDINGNDICSETLFLKRFGPKYDITDIL